DPCWRVVLWMMTVLLIVGCSQAQSKAGTATQSGTPPTSVASPPHPDEDWNDLSLSKSSLHQDQPVAVQADRQPQFTRELIQVKWRNGDPIDLYIIRPNGVAKPPVVLYLYSYPSETDRFRSNDYCERVTRGGFTAVGFVSALTGHRYHSRPMKQW